MWFLELHTTDWLKSSFATVSLWSHILRSELQSKMVLFKKCQGCKSRSSFLLHFGFCKLNLSKFFFFFLQGCENGMTLIADNPFISKKELVPFEKGIRIDYILFKVSESSMSSDDFYKAM